MVFPYRPIASKTYSGYWKDAHPAVFCQQNLGIRSMISITGNPTKQYPMAEGAIATIFGERI
ncbi:MAG: hypothetical protein F6K09_04445 [Merismopedia sp. SIO2A8]|nr:hypothetical protein [Merismopedia sp. SIO2A8]